MPNVIFAAVTAFAIAYLTLPTVIGFALKKRIYTPPGDRSSHSRPTPSLGGLCIFCGVFIATLFWTPGPIYAELKFVLLAVLIIFLTGLRDDLVPLSAQKKLLAQLLTATLIVYFADIRLESLHGMFSWSGPMPYELSILLSVFTILVVTNAFNLIDGINGLAASLGALSLLLLGIWFAAIDQVAYSVVALSSFGALLAFLRFNLIPPTRIFMGDTGSLVIGTIVSVLVLEFIELNAGLPAADFWRTEAVAVVAMTLISIPLFDTLRVFVTRIIRGSSPFMPDRRHIHHLLIDYGYSHAKATGILVACNLLLIVMVLALQGRMEQHLLLLLLLSLISAATYMLHRATMRKKTALQALLAEEDLDAMNTAWLNEEYQHLN